MDQSLVQPGDPAIGQADEGAREEPLPLLLRDLRTSAEGLSEREAGRRLLMYGENVLTRHTGRRWPKELAAQFTHPLALLLAAAAVLATVNGALTLAEAVVAVIIVNAVFAFVQEIHAEHAVRALSAYLPESAVVIREGVRRPVDVSTLVPGDGSSSRKGTASRPTLAF